MSLAFDTAPDALSSPQELIERHTTVEFGYGHQGTSIDPAKVEVRYVTPEGEAVAVSLAEFTDGALVQPGDVVQIEPGQHGTPTADLATAIEVVQSGKVLAARTGASRDWVKAGGLPLPLAFSQAGRASWDFEAGGSLAIELGGMRIDAVEERCDWESYWEEEWRNEGSSGEGSGDGTGEESWNATEDHPGADDGEGPYGRPNPTPYPEPDCWEEPVATLVDRLSAQLSQRVAGSVHATVALPAEGPRLAFSSALEATAGATVDASIQSDGESYGGTLDASYTVRVIASELALQFDAGRELSSITRQAQASIAGEAQGTGDFRFGEDGHTMAEEESFGPVTEPFTAEAQATEAFVRFLSNAWGLDMAPGDELAFQFDVPDAPILARFVSQVLAIESRNVAGEVRQAFKVSDSMTIDLDPLGVSPQHFAYDYLYWIDTQSHLPLYMQGQVERTFGQGELQAYLETTTQALEPDGDVRFQLPPGASLTLSLDSTFEMAADSTDLATSALLGSAGARLVPMAAASLLWGAGFGTGGGRGGYAEEPAHWVPEVGFAFDDVAATITVVRAQGYMVYLEDLAWRGCAVTSLNGGPPPSEQDLVLAGDVLGTSCLPGDEMLLLHLPSNTVLATHHYP